MHKIAFQADNRFVERVLCEDCSGAVGCFYLFIFIAGALRSLIVFFMSFLVLSSVVHLHRKCT